jgi:hypothetical protein
MNINMIIKGKPFAYQVRAEPKPIGGLLDSRFKYVPACKTDVAATLERVRRELASGERKL